MKPGEDFERAAALFEQITAASPEHRDVILDKALKENPQLHALVLRMLAADARESGPLPQLADDSGFSSPMISFLDPSKTPDQIGEYRILGILGRGAMGVIYRAEQESPRRIVALKVVHPGILGDSTRKRFEYEVAILGKLRHPCIAQIYHAGTSISDSGVQPYFAMELIEGTTLVEWVRENNLEVKDSLVLFTRICEGAHHAHQKGIIPGTLNPAIFSSTPRENRRYSISA